MDTPDVLRDLMISIVAGLIVAMALWILSFVF